MDREDGAPADRLAELIEQAADPGGEVLRRCRDPRNGVREEFHDSGVFRDFARRSKRVRLVTQIAHPGQRELVQVDRVLGSTNFDGD